MLTSMSEVTANAQRHLHVIWESHRIRVAQNLCCTSRGFPHTEDTTEEALKCCLIAEATSTSFAAAAVDVKLESIMQQCLAAASSSS